MRIDEVEKNVKYLTNLKGWIIDEERIIKELENAPESVDICIGFDHRIRDGFKDYIPGSSAITKEIKAIVLNYHKRNLKKWSDELDGCMLFRQNKL